MDWKEKKFEEDIYLDVKNIFLDFPIEGEIEAKGKG